MALVHGLPRAEPLWKIAPVRPGPDPVENPVDHLSVITPPSAPPIADRQKRPQLLDRTGSSRGRRHGARSRLYLKLGLGSSALTRLSASRVQAFFNGQLAAGRSVRTVQVMKTVLFSALSRAMREELVVRNVARLAELPTWERQHITPWAVAEARTFLEAAKNDPLYPAFVLLLLYGLRRGEVLGRRWRDIDEDDGEIRVRQQVQRITSPEGLGLHRWQLDRTRAC
jgi:integrase